MLKNQCIPGLPDVAKLLFATVSRIEKVNTLEKFASAKRKEKKRMAVVKRLVVALEAEAKEVQGDLMQNGEAVEGFDKRA